MLRTVKEVAELTGVTVRTLHHYDELGLLTPSERSPAGYRLYDRGDLERLQEILVHRALGLSLAEIRDLLDDPEHDRVLTLKQQRERLAERIDELHAMVDAVDAALAAHEEGTEVSDETLFEGMENPYEDEARERWGDTEAWAQSQRRMRSYDAEQFEEIKAEGEAIAERLAAIKRAGEAPDSEAAMGAAEAHRQHIHRWFYDCPPAMHASLGEMYPQDERFRAYYDDREPGLAAWVAEAYAANAARQTG